MEAGSVNCCVTSPPYFGLRDYGNDEQIGLEETPEAFVESMVNVFREVKRVLADDGTLWLNLGDSYGKEKQLIGIPWRVALALQADGWYLRQDIIWSKPNPMPESVTDRCTKAHEYIFLLSKKPKYFYDAEPIREPIKETSGSINGAPLRGDHVMTEGGRKTESRQYDEIKGANKRSVWNVNTQPYAGAHFATFPPDLIKPCIMAGCPTGGTVLDPFGGSGTTGMVALELGRSAELIELNPDYVEIIEGRTHVTPGLAL
jgi:DNA modification methylase